MKSFMVRATLCTLSSPRVVTPSSTTRRHCPDVHTGAPVVRGTISSSGKTRRGRGAVTMKLWPRSGAWHWPRVVTRCHEAAAGLGCPLSGSGVPGGCGGCPIVAGVWHGDTEDWILVTSVTSLTTLTGVRLTLSSCGSADSIFQKHVKFNFISVLISFKNQFLQLVFFIVKLRNSLNEIWNYAIKLNYMFTCELKKHSRNYR